MEASLEYIQGQLGNLRKSNVMRYTYGADGHSQIIEKSYIKTKVLKDVSPSKN